MKAPRRHALVSVALALGAVAIAILWQPEDQGLPGWSTKLVAAALIAASLAIYRYGCKRCQD